MPELRDLRWAIVAAQHRSLRRAAELLNIRQSTLSRTLRGLEHDLGVVLFERTNGGTRPTIVGQEFLEAARRIIDGTDEITARLKTRSRGESGRLTIGVHVSLSAGNLRATLLEYHRRFPAIATHLVDGTSDHLISDLGSSAIDVAFIAASNPKFEGRSLPVWSERVVAALPSDHPLSSRDVVHWAELKGESLLLPLRGPGREFQELLIRKIGCPLSCRLSLHDVGIDRLLTLVGTNRGILLVLEGATGAVYPGVTFREVHDERGPTWLNFRACWRASNCNPSLGPFVKALQERYPDLGTDPGAV
jgi:DNA-binding transcriptional LysR family regulator